MNALYRSILVLTVVAGSGTLAFGQSHTDELLQQVYGATPARPDGYTFTKVIHYNILQLVEGGKEKEKQVVEGIMDLYYTPGQQAYGRVVVSEDGRIVHLGDLTLGMRYTLATLGEVKVGSETALSAQMKDTLQMSRVSGDREIDGRMSAHYWHENGTVIDELWADSQASEEEVAIGRLWPQFEPGFASLATGSYVGLATRWVAIDTKFSRDPRMVLEFKGAEELDKPMELSLEGFVFPVSEADMMRERLNAERQ